MVIGPQWLHCKLQTRPLVGEGALQEEVWVRRNSFLANFSLSTKANTLPKAKKRVTPIIINIGSTALCGPWPSFFNFATNNFLVRIVNLTTFSNPGGSMISVRMFYLRSPPLHHVAQEPWRGRACVRLARSTWRFLCFVSLNSSARCLFTGPHINPVATKPIPN
jgi:hypothetical protein